MRKRGQSFNNNTEATTNEIEAVYLGGITPNQDGLDQAFDSMYLPEGQESQIPSKMR